jgi:hypothetical protein
VYSCYFLIINAFNMPEAEIYYSSLSDTLWFAEKLNLPYPAADTWQIDSSGGSLSGAAWKISFSENKPSYRMPLLSYYAVDRLSN